jgi:hypothetical protein
LSAGLRALARSIDEPSFDAMGARLQAAFAAHHAPAQRVPVPRWVQAAAAIALIAGAVIVWRVVAAPKPEPRHELSAVASKPVDPPLLPVGGAPVTPDRSLAPPQGHTAPQRTSRTTTRGRAPRVIRAEGFVALPSAVGLPDFESGQIVRLELPLAMLPSYGIQIVPDARGPQVEADLLVGQDGQPRAIRLISTVSESGSR